MLFSSHDLARRLERAEAHACAQFAEAKARLTPGCGSAWIDCAGAYAVFDGPDSPVTQSFGLGLFAELDDHTLSTIEHFFHERGAPVQHEVSPFAGVAALDLLCRRGYRPIELTSVLYRPVEPLPVEPPRGVAIRIISNTESPIWNETSARGWAAGQPEFFERMKDFGAVTCARKDSTNFLAEVEGTPAATAVLAIHEGVALFAGASTVPEMRCRGLQQALHHARMAYAAAQGCTLASIGTLPGSDSQRNAERAGFRIAYTRTKWKLSL